MWFVHDGGARGDTPRQIGAISRASAARTGFTGLLVIPLTAASMMTGVMGGEPYLPCGTARKHRGIAYGPYLMLRRIASYAPPRCPMAPAASSPWLAQRLAQHLLQQRGRV